MDENHASFIWVLKTDLRGGYGKCLKCGFFHDFLFLFWPRVDLVDVGEFDSCFEYEKVDACGMAMFMRLECIQGLDKILDVYSRRHAYWTILGLVKKNLKKNFLE